MIFPVTLQMQVSFTNKWSQHIYQYRLLYDSMIFIKTVTIICLLIKMCWKNLL